MNSGAPASASKALDPIPVTSAMPYAYKTDAVPAPVAAVPVAPVAAVPESPVVQVDVEAGFMLNEHGLWVPRVLQGREERSRASDRRV